MLRGGHFLSRRHDEARWRAFAAFRAAASASSQRVVPELMGVYAVGVAAAAR